jgi:hypothetical protein
MKRLISGLQQMQAQGIQRRTLMRRATTSVQSNANDPHYLRTTISSQDETAARHMSQALKCERAIGESANGSWGS